ncbi:MAG TPA: hypothetical protein VG126_05560 [Thermoleophilaceae bacterium]|nr:hypothetical protein [Thermoleophilaceae bacterium]
MAPGEREALRFRLRRARLRTLRREGMLTLTGRARNRDRAEGTVTAISFTVARR